MSSELSHRLSRLTTEQRNKNSMNLDQMSTMEILKTMNEEDKKVATAVEKVLGNIEKAIELTYAALRNGGRLFYVGAGTSGRLAVLDASEWVPTFNTSPDLVQAVMAGGSRALDRASEGSEDDEAQGKADLKERKLSSKDIVIGITASGRTPYPIGALKHAREIGCTTVSLTCNQNSEISRYADCKIEVVVGPEVLSGSTRMKAATAHKMVLNMISTTVMIKWGKVYENLMVDVSASNYKLRERCKRIVMEITGVTYERAQTVLENTDFRVKPAVVMVSAGVSFAEAESALKKTDGNVREAIACAKARTT